jgi:hypothetical protein
MERSHFLGRAAAVGERRPPACLAEAKEIKPTPATQSARLSANGCVGKPV